MENQDQESKTKSTSEIIESTNKEGMIKDLAGIERIETHQFEIALIDCLRRIASGVEVIANRMPKVPLGRPPVQLEPQNIELDLRVKGEQLLNIRNSVIKTFRSYGYQIRSWNTHRSRLLKSRVSEGFKEEDIVGAVHGYVAYHENRDNSPHKQWDPKQHFTPETVLRPTHFLKYLEAYQRAVANGRKPPYSLEVKGDDDPIKRARLSWERQMKKDEEKGKI